MLYFDKVYVFLLLFNNRLLYLHKKKVATLVLTAKRPNIVLARRQSLSNWTNSKKKLLKSKIRKKIKRSVKTLNEIEDIPGKSGIKLRKVTTARMVKITSMAYLHSSVSSLDSSCKEVSKFVAVDQTVCKCSLITSSHCI